MAYRIAGLDPEPFRPLFDLSDRQLAKRGIGRVTVDRKPRFPCRVSLVDRDLGEQVLLLNYVSNDVANPFRSSHAIFVGEGAEQAEFVDDLPPVFEGRVLSLRGFDGEGMMADALLAPAGEADRGIRTLFENPLIAQIHAHNAAWGCFSARIERN